MKNIILLFLILLTTSFNSSVFGEEGLYPILRVSEVPQPLLFRKATDPFDKKFEANREGLDTLRLSGSAQFSAKELEDLKSLIPAKKVIIVDLRRESHGYVNGDIIAWKLPDEDKAYDYNAGLTAAEIEEKEYGWLFEILQQKPFFIKTYDAYPRLLTPCTISTERELVEQSGWSYIRLPLADHTFPEDQQVDEIIHWYLSLPKEAWLHAHCAGGKGRSTVFMSMIDMMRNSSKLSVEEILLRQQALGGSNLLDPDASYPPGSILLEEAFVRLDRLRKFHAYCLENPTFTVSWSKWINQKQTSRE